MPARTMTSRERVTAALRHQEPDRVPADLGGTGVSGITIFPYVGLRRALGVNGNLPKVTDLVQMNAEVELPVLEQLGCDVVGVAPVTRTFGIAYRDYRPWTAPDGTPMAVPGQFQYQTSPDGDLLLSPRGDLSVPPSGRMPKGGYYFDFLPRQRPLDWDHLDPREFAEQFTRLPDEELAHLQARTDYLYRNTDYAIVANFGERGLGNMPLVMAPELDAPKGIRAFDDWLMAHATHPQYIRDINALHTERILGNLELLHQAVGSKVVAVYLTATDFGTQRGEFTSPDVFRDLYFPFHRRLCTWVHEHTTWKTFLHSCGSVYRLIPMMIEAGVDILNPVQCSAANMEPARLKREFGSKLVFWGGGVDTQKTLPFGTPDEVRAEVRERVRIFAPGGGYVFNPIHNIQAKTPVENILAAYQTVRETGRYPIT